MPNDDIVETAEIAVSQIENDSEFEDITIKCMDCTAQFVWTAGEQAFYRDKQLQNPPKRCKDCKRAKNHRLAAIEIAHVTGIRQRIEVRASCAKCFEVTTIPFYPSQGRPVFCRACYAAINAATPNGNNGNAQDA